ncbi:MAG TPA: glycosyltransferase [Gemmatimonadaceae bacterium]|nr:glycosyltransferase [Gemmatimonadaceae bacterium]
MTSPARLFVFWDYDTQWGADRSRRRGATRDWGALEFPNTDELLELHARYEVPACFAVVGAAALPGKRPYHDPAQVRRIHAAGHEVASHAHRHEWLPGLGAAALRETLRASRDALEQCIGAPVRSFVPPYNQPFDHLAGWSPSLSERREARPERTDLRRLCDALTETGYEFCRVAYRPLSQRIAERAVRRALDRPVELERIGTVTCVRLNTAGGFDHDTLAVLERGVHRGGVVVIYGHPHSLHVGNSQDARWLVPLLERVQRWRAAGRLAVVQPRDVSASQPSRSSVARSAPSSVQPNHTPNHTPSRARATDDQRAGVADRASRRLRVCMICPEYPPGPHGGVGSFTQVMARALAHAGHDVRVIGVHPAWYPAPDYEEDEGVRVWRLRDAEGRGDWVRARIALYRQIRRWSRDGEIDVVEAPDHSGWYAGWPRLAVPLLLRSNGSMTYFAHELDRPCVPNRRRLETWGHQRADAWAAVSSYIARVNQKVFGLRTEPLAILYNPVDVPPAPAPFDAREPARVVFTGTLATKKGVLALAEAWPMIAARVPCAELHMIGKDDTAPDGGSMMAHLRTALPPELRGQLHLHGHLDRQTVIEWLTTARVAVFPSISEAFGIAPVEAMATGCPTIYTRLSCGPEIVRDEVDGLLVDPRNPAEIASSVIRILEDPELARRLSVAGHRRARDAFATEHGLAATERYYEAALARFHGRSS